MKCPNCNATLVMADKQGVEIDYCPECRGVWLDKGELEKILERSSVYYSAPEADRDRHYSEYRKQYPQGGGQHYDPHYKHKKKKGFLDDFFDF